ncbi:MAG TPA: hypothetical protein VMV19_16090, partial [Xanthobacteraceae bacterium]|nr:hypothetical protein [Xanthobacteraceae bacterium]
PVVLRNTLGLENHANPGRFGHEVEYGRIGLARKGFSALPNSKCPHYPSHGAILCHYPSTGSGLADPSPKYCGGIPEPKAPFARIESFIGGSGTPC